MWPYCGALKAISAYRLCNDSFFFFICCYVIQMWFINILILFSYEVACKQDAAHVMRRSNHETQFYLSAFTVPVKQLVGKCSSSMFQYFIYVAFHLTCAFVMKIVRSCAEHSQANLSDKILWKMFSLDQGLWTFCCLVLNIHQVCH